MVTTKPISLFNLKKGDIVYYYAYDENYKQYINHATFKEWGNNYGCIVLETTENGNSKTIEKVVRDVFAL